MRNKLSLSLSCKIVHTTKSVIFISRHFVRYYAALLPRRGPHIASHSVRLSVCLSVRPVIVAIGNVFSSTASVTDVLFGTH